ncbi:RES domain-containing protein [Bradyrhizobium sp. HKCCYLS1011]|uniref:RES domain-containing protein n=1 Tax=Bradyrhizobium sp. HKCCYLS1011 TaxID=3420733 RepID=UPI003EBB8128
MSEPPLSDEDPPETKNVCFACVGDEYLSAKIKRLGASKPCSYCGEKRRVIPIEELADHVETAFEQHYERTSPDPDDFEHMMMSDRESGYTFLRHGDPVVWAIAGAAEIDETIAADVQRILEERHADIEMAKAGEECEFASESYYEAQDTNDVELRHEWQYFEHSLKTQSRFFNKHAEAVLAELFDGLLEHETFDGRRVVIELGPGREIASLFRTRVFQSEGPLKEALERPDKGLGPPPEGVATGGRMNARGISVFYGALEAEIALAEIRPPVGSRVMLGKFELARVLKVLDVEALRSVLVKGSVFDGGHLHKLERAKFLGRLSERITRPIMPDDEPSDYLVTQAIAEYLASRVGLDGILYPSAQAGGAKKNVVLFHHASRVKPLELPPNTELEARTRMTTSDGQEADYWVSEEVPEPKPAPVPQRDRAFPFIALEPSETESAGDADFRDVTLNLDLESVEVHHVEAVSFRTTAHSVRRHRWQKRSEPDF